LVNIHKKQAAIQVNCVACGARQGLTVVLKAPYLVACSSTIETPPFMPPTQTDKPFISLIFPAYNEVSRIRETVSEACAYFEAQGLSYQIVVAADGTDGTRETVTEMAQTNPRLLAVGNKERRGKGYGLRQAIPHCTGTYIGFSDADNKTPITEFDKVLPLLQDGADLVIGQRPHGGALIEKKQNLVRRVGSRVFKIYMHTMVGLRNIYDTQCGFKFFRAEVARDLFARQQIDGYMYDVEILYLADKAGYRIDQIEVRWRDDGDSRLNLISGNIKNFADVAKVRSLHAGANLRQRTTENVG
jgi:dolichyl-phosphate beta-glucosyltransferase